MEGNCSLLPLIESIYRKGVHIFSPKLYSLFYDLNQRGYMKFVTFSCPIKLNVDNCIPEFQQLSLHNEGMKV